MSTATKQIPLSTGALIVGGATGRGAELAAGANGEQLQIIGGTVTYVPKTTIAAVDPTSDNDNVDTAAAGRAYFPGDTWFNNAGSPVRVFDCVSANPGAAVWKIRAESTRSAFTYRGNVDASNSATAGLLTGILADPNVQDGDLYRVITSDATGTFAGQWDASSNPEFIGATFEVGDNIVVFNGAFDKQDNTDPAGVTVFQIGRFQEAGPAVAQTGSFALVNQIPSTLQGGNADSVEVMINGESINFDQFNLTGAGPFTVNIDAGLLGYPVDANDTIKVRYAAG